jgi:hypothetical protein
MPRVRIKASEVVRYDDIVDMSEDDFERLQEARQEGLDEEINWIVENYLNREEIDSRSAFELVDSFECDINGNEVDNEKD